MSFDLNELVTPVTRAEFEQSIYDVISAVGTEHTGWKPGSVARTMIAAFAIMLAGLSTLIAAFARSGFLDYAEGAWLRLLGKNTFNEIAEEATFAPGLVTLVNTGGGLYNLDPDDLILLNTATGKTYRNTGAITLNPGATLTDVPILAVERGSDSSALIGQIDDFVTPLVGVTVTNPAAVVGQDAVSDPVYRDLCRAKPSTLSPNGPEDAYNYFARKAPRLDGSIVPVTRSESRPGVNGGVNVYVATATGGVVGDQNDPATDLGAVADNIWKNVTPLTVNPDVQSAVPVAIPVTYSVWVRANSGLTAQAVQDAIEAALTTFFAGQPIGGIILPPATTGAVYVSALRAAVGTAVPEIFDTLVATPAGDTALALNEVPTLGTITVTAINLVEA